MFSMKTVYGLKALQYLAEKQTGEHVLISEIAASANIPKKFLETILLTLKNEGILTSKIGKGGGYQLASPPEAITMLSIINALEGSVALVPCVVDESGAKCEYCEDSSICGVRLIMLELSNGFSELLNGATLADMTRLTQDAVLNSNKVINYII